jgi:hypothetical protein
MGSPEKLGASLHGWACFLMSYLTWDALTAGATILGVFFVARQLYLLRDQLRLQQYIEYTKRYQEIVLSFPESINEASFLLENLPRDERDKTMRHMRAYFDLCFEEWDLKNKKLVDQKFWDLWKGGMEFAFSKPSFQQAWKIIETDSRFGPEFEAFVGNAMKRSSRLPSPLHGTGMH